MMNKQDCLNFCLMGTAGLSALAAQAAQPQRKQPHIILLMTDQQRADLYLCFQVILNNLEQYIDQKEASVPPCTSQSRKEGTDA